MVRPFKMGRGTHGFQREAQKQRESRYGFIENDKARLKARAKTAPPGSTSALADRRKAIEEKHLAPGVKVFFPGELIGRAITEITDAAQLRLEGFGFDVSPIQVKPNR